MRTRFAVLGTCLLALAACKEGRRAPTEPPLVPSFASVIADFVYGGGDAGAEFRYPQVLLSGPQIYIVSAGLALQQTRFAGCPGSCNLRGNWLAGTAQSVRNGVLFVSAALTPTGLHIVYDGEHSLRYATCPGLCYDSTHWQSVAVDSVSPDNWFPAIAADNSGGLHVVYEPGNQTELHYAECVAGCLSSNNWSLTVIDRAAEILYSKIGIDGNGRIHVLYHAQSGLGPSGLKYATCAASCADPTQWSTAVVDEFAVGGPPYGAIPSLGIAKDNRLHVAYWAPAGVRYATCGSNCSSLANWTAATIATPATFPLAGSVGLAIGPSDRLHLVYPGDSVRYASCVSSCTDSHAWESITIGQEGLRADFVALAVDSLDQPHLALSAGGAVLYAWRQQ
jgi:hypothetical protein